MGQNLGQFAFAQPFGFLDAGSDINDTIANLCQTLYESGMMGQVPFMEKWTRSNPIWKYLPSKGGKFYLLFNMATEVLTKFQNDAESDDHTKCLLQSLLDSVSIHSDKFTIHDVLAISMGAM
jgi:hypothetical protein